MRQSKDNVLSDEIAIVGRSCRLPGAASVAAFWQLLAEGRCAVTTIPPDRWMLARNLHPRQGERGRTYTWAAGVLDDIWGFDPGVFGLSPREAEQMDPQQRLLLELTWEALEDAGIRPSLLAGSDAGVFIGASAVDHANLRMLDMAAADAYMMTGNTLSILANRLSHVFDLHGPSFTIDTACSSSLVALNEAVASLRHGRIDTAIVGGVSILASPQSFVGFSQASMLSRRGLCQAFSDTADGYVRAEGGIVLVLKTRTAAERDGDPIHGFVVATDINSDGRTNGIAMPSKAFQAKLLETVYRTSCLDPSALAFVEAHGTGTPVGDPIEAMALGESLGRRRGTPLLIGSVKTNIGHMEAASGLGGLLKAMLALEHDRLPPSLHSDTLNPSIDFEGLNLVVARDLVPLSRPSGGRRLAGINSFGFGGTNAHVVLADAPLPPPVRIAAAPSYLVLSAHSRSALSALAADYATRLETSDDGGAAALMAATGHQRDRFVERIVIPVGSRADIAAALAALPDETQGGPCAVCGTAVECAAPVAFVFSGNGSQCVGMGLAAYAHSQVFRARLDAISEAFAAISGWSIVDMLRADDLATRLARSRVAQPLLFAIQSATCHALRHHGLEPDVVFGHSVGEIAAAEAAGILDGGKALELVYTRSLYQELAFGHGGMAVVIGSREAIDAILLELPDLEIAAFNSPRAFTLSGSRRDVARLSEVAVVQGARVRKLDLDYPFHSAGMAPVEHPLLCGLKSLSPEAASVPFLSTVTGAMMDGRKADGRYWWRNVREPVRFADAVTAAIAQGARIFVEIGPTATLLSHIADNADPRVATVATLAALEQRKSADPIAMTVARALARGAKVDEDKVFGSGPGAGARVSLPPYPWQRKVFRLPESSESLGSLQTKPWHPLIGSRINSDQLEWRSCLDTTCHPWLADHCIDGQTILPGAAFVEMALAVARDWLGTDQVVVCELEITSPALLAAPLEIACRVSPIASYLEIASRPRLSHEPWQVHATGKIIRNQTTGTPSFDEKELGRPATPLSRACREERSHGAGDDTVAGTEIYALARRAGLQFGPAFRKLETATAIRPDLIVVTLLKGDVEPTFGLDPAQLDSCFHGLVLAFARGREVAYLPVRFGEIVLRKPGVTVAGARIDVRRCDERILIADVTMFDCTGTVVAALREARFQAVHAIHAIDAAGPPIYQTAILASEPTAGRHDRAVSLAMVRRNVVRADRSTIDDDVLVEGWTTSFALRLARDLAINGHVDVGGLVANGRLPANLRPWFESVLLALDRSGLCRWNGNIGHVDTEIALPDPDVILRAIAQERQELATELLAASSTRIAVAAIVAGATPDPFACKVIEAFETRSHLAQASALCLAGILRASSEAWPKDRAMRILQIGSVALTTHTMRLAGDTSARLTILEVDQGRRARARVNVDDVELVDSFAALPESGFDLVVAVHGLRGPAVWSGLRRAMAPGAIFAAIEPAPSFFREFVLGLAAGLGGLERYERVVAWSAVLQGAGFREAEVAPIMTDAGPALLLTAQVEAARRHWVGAGTAFIVGDDTSGTQTAFATLLASAGMHVSIVYDNDFDAALRAETPSVIVRFLRSAYAPGAPVKRLLDPCMDLKRLVERLGDRAARLWLVASGLDRDADVTAGFWAFSRTVANERPKLDIRRVTVSTTLRAAHLAERLRDLVLSGTEETEISLDDSTTHIVRFDTRLPRENVSSAEAARLTRGESAGIDRMAWIAIPRRAPGCGDVEIAVEAAGLNFRDVMFGLGLLPEDILEHGFAGPTLGLECAGRIVRVGAGVKDLALGDRVMAFAKNAFATHVTTPAAFVAPVSGRMTMEAAATIPVAFVTAYYALISCAQLKRNEWVLIHGGAGGVGLAAIQIAHWRGARVIATAGSAEKRALLQSLGAAHVFDSRAGAFIADVRRTAGEGVSVVLNSLSGDAMERSMSLLRPFGRFVELGKRDYVANTHVGLRPFRRNLTYFGVDLDQLLVEQPAVCKRLMRTVLRLFASHDLAPLPYRAFEAAESSEAFRLMQQAGHIGKLVLHPPDPSDIVSRPRTGFHVSSDKMHLVTGGLRGFGLETARWLVAKGARNLMLVGRNAPSNEDLAAFRVPGVRVDTAIIDVANRGAVRRLLSRFGRDLPALAGVVHAAMVLEDALLADITAEAMERVLRPKVAGAVHLDHLTREMPLDYFLLYSSAATLLGNPGQAAYVAANGFLEGLARRRRRFGLPAVAIAWGAIEDVGVLARSATTRERLATKAGVKAMKAQDALHRLGEILGAPHDAVVAIAPMDWAIARQHLAVLKAPAYRKLASADEAVADTARNIDIAALVADATPDAARRLTASLIVDEIARILRLPREDVARTKPLSEIGLDSLMAVELALGLKDRFTLATPLSPTAGRFTVYELADHIVGLATGRPVDDTPAAQVIMDRHLGVRVEAPNLETPKAVPDHRLSIMHDAPPRS